jgi:hypothetical protein
MLEFWLVVSNALALFQKSHTLIVLGLGRLVVVMMTGFTGHG